MRKKLAGLAVATTLALTLVACGSNTDNSGASQTPPATTAPTEAPAKEVNIADIVSKLQAELGEAYTMNMELKSEEIDAKFGLQADWYEEAYAALPMIGTHADVLAIVKAKTENVDEVKAALEAYKQARIDDQMQYPMNLIKVQATRVEVYGDYVVLCLTGFISNEVEETGDDDKILAAYKQENDKTVAIIESFLK